MTITASEVQVGDRLSLGGPSFQVTYAMSTPLDGSVTIQAQPEGTGSMTLAVPGDQRLKVTRDSEPQQGLLLEAPGMSTVAPS